MNNISKHISYYEATRSRTASRYGIDNTPSKEDLERMRLTANMVFEPVRIHFGIPIYVSSFYRSPKLNKKVGGSKTSSHQIGESIDIDDVLGGVTNAEIFNYIKTNLEFDQLIWEFGDDLNPAWIHVSFSSRFNRNQVLRAVKYTDRIGRKRTKYIKL